ncbi:type IV pilus modification PilV family protein [Chitinimonas naiadis]
MCTERRQGGFTLFELLFFILIVGIAVAGVLLVYGVTAKSSGDPLVRKQALMIAESMLEEVLLQPFSAPTGAYAGSSRTLYDHVSAYNGYSATGITTLDGVAVAGLGAYTVQVSATQPSAPVGGVVASDVWVITVTVTDALGATTRLTGYRFNYG